MWRKSLIYLLSIGFLFILIGLSTSIKPTYRFSSKLITEWTKELNEYTFLYLLGMENRIFHDAYPKHIPKPNLSKISFQLITNMRPNDLRSVMSQELPGFRTFDHQIIIAGEGTNYMNLSFESSPPLEDVLREREAVFDEPEIEESPPFPPKERTTGDKKVVFLYSTHNRESFLPHLPAVENPNLAHHPEVNITKVGEHLKKGLESRGIGVEIDSTDHMSRLKERGWSYGQSYDSSREIFEEALQRNEDIQYAFDIHRDALTRDLTTKEIDGKLYAKILIVIGAEYDHYERNLTLATTLHQRIEEKYPGLSRGVITKKGPGNNGIYNQDLLENAILIEFGGHENTLVELYRTADIVAEVFADYYWEIEKVNKDR